MRRLFTRRNVVIFLLLVSFTGLGVFLWPRSASEIETKQVKRGDIIESLAVSGTVAAKKTVDLKFLAAGKLVYLGVQKGDYVQQGQVIATLDQRTVQRSLEDDLRDYSKQRNTFDQTREDNQNRTPEQALNDRMKRVLQTNQYDLEKSVISVELQQLAKEQSVLITPISGIVTDTDITTAGVNVTTTTKISIADPSTMVFQIDVDEADIGRVKPEQEVIVVLDAYPDDEMKLRINSIDFVTHETATGGNAYTIEVQLPENSNTTYRIGMRGDAEIILEQRKGVLTVPLASVVEDNAVYSKTKEGFEKRKVTFGIKNEIDVEVLSGLSLNDIIAVDLAEVEKEIGKKKFFFF